VYLSFRRKGKGLNQTNTWCTSQRRLQLQFTTQQQYKVAVVTGGWSRSTPHETKNQIQHRPFNTFLFSEPQPHTSSIFCHPFLIISLSSSPSNKKTFFFLFTACSSAWNWDTPLALFRSLPAKGFNFVTLAPYNMCPMSLLWSNSSNWATGSCLLGFCWWLRTFDLCFPQVWFFCFCSFSLFNPSVYWFISSVFLLVIPGLLLLIAILLSRFLEDLFNLDCLKVLWGSILD